jgi:CMP-N,N'-diacetyllegionaminic acid synthase
MKIVAFIPARSGSKSIKDKNIKNLGGMPLIGWTIEKARSAGIENIIVNTDSKEYADIAQSFGAEVMPRPAHLGQDNTSMFELLRNEIPKTGADLVMLLQPTTPFRNRNHLIAAISYLTNNLDKFDSLVAVEKVPEKYNPAVVIIQTSNGKGMVMGRVTNWFERLLGKKHTEPTLSGVPVSQRITARQDNPDAWVPTGSIYLFKAENLKKGSLYGDRVMLLETEPTININTQEDWDKAELWLKKEK